MQSAAVKQLKWYSKYQIPFENPTVEVLSVSFIWINSISFLSLKITYS